MATELYDPRIPPREDCIVGEAIDRWARDTPDKVFVAVSRRHRAGPIRQLRDVVRADRARPAAARRQAGRLCDVWLPNGSDALRVILRASTISARSNVPANLAYRGHLLAHVDPQFAGQTDRRARRPAAAARRHRLRRADPGRRARRRIRAAQDAAVASRADALAPTPSALAPPERPIEPWDTQMVIYTSGTTGPSKGVLSSYLHFYTGGAEPFRVSDRRRSLPDQPADVPHRRLRHPELHADDRRLGRDRRILRDRKILAGRTRDASRPRRRCSA